MRGLVSWVFLAVGIVALAAGLVLAASADGHGAPVICESGAFEPVPATAADPYVRQRATCNVGSSSGPAVAVVVID